MGAGVCVKLMRLSRRTGHKVEWESRELDSGLDGSFASLCFEFLQAFVSK